MRFMDWFLGFWLVVAIVGLVGLFFFGCAGQGLMPATDGSSWDALPERCPGGMADMVTGEVAFSFPSRIGLIAWWSFDDPDLVAVDHSGNGNDGVVRGAVQVLGKVGMAYRFDGDACVTVPRSPSLDMAGATALTMMAWVRPAVGCSANNAIIMSKDLQYEHSVYCAGAFPYQEAISPSAGANVGEWSWNGMVPMRMGEWRLVATVWDGQVASVYMDGFFMESFPVSGTVRSSLSGLGIGCGHVPADGGKGHDFFYGSIDEVFLYDRALTAVEVRVYYDGTR